METKGTLNCKSIIETRMRTFFLCDRQSLFLHLKKYSKSHDADENDDDDEDFMKLLRLLN